jgi:hypothetical protein
LEDVVTPIVKCSRPERTGSTRPEPLSAKSAGTLFVAVVHAPDGVRFAAAAESRHELVHRIADYVRQWGGYLLRPDHARHLRGLLARGESEAAIELYFGLVGKRWDKEWLVTTVTTTNGRPNVAGVLGEVVVPEALRDKPADRDGRDRELPEADVAERLQRDRALPLARAL